ncbi:MAG: metallophosphoesterase [Bradyrhizobium sp.]|uniref:metallophosphoesterase family protein n=1 Tax=Bradyrhizobium sp. TaxID=376 RepID=UPI003D0C2499
MSLKSASPRYNKYAPMADRLIFAPYITEGSGVTVNDLAIAANALGDATLNANVTWGGTAGAEYIDFAGTSGADVPMSIADPGGTADWLLPDWCVMVDFSNVGDNSTARPIFASSVTSNITTTHAVLLAQFISGADTIRVTLRDQAANLTRTYDFTSVNRTNRHVLFIWGGAGGVQAELDGAAPDSSSESPSAYTGPLRCVDTGSIAWGRNAGGGLMLGRIHNTAIWSAALSAEQRSRFYVDPGLNVREPAGMAVELAAATARANLTAYTVGNLRKFTSGDWLYECVSAGTSDASEPADATYDTQQVDEAALSWDARVASLFLGWAGPTWQGRVTTTTFSWRFVTSPWLVTASVYVRVKYATTKAGIEAGTAVTSAQVTAAATPITLTATGLTANTRYYYQAEWSTDNATWYPFPCGIGQFITMGGTEPGWIDFSDCHINVGVGGICPSDLGWGDNIALAAGTTNVNEVTGYRNRWAAFRTAADIVAQDPPHFMVWHGDHIMGDSDPDLSSDDTTSEKWQYARSFTTFYCQVIVRQNNVLVLGNHEGECGGKQEISTTNAMQKQCFNVRIATVCNPDADTYAEGGEDADSSSDWVWPTSAGAQFLHATDRMLENYFAFTWGGHLFVFLDSCRYAGIDESSSEYYAAPESWKLGATQSAWLQGVLAGSTSAIKVVIAHNLFGGIGAGTTNGGSYYARGSGNEAAVASAEAAIHALMRKHGVTVYSKGHDHKYDIVRRGGVYYVTSPTAGAPSHSSAGRPGWNVDTATGLAWFQIRDSYGSAESLGALDSDGDAMPATQIKHYNTMGYISWSIAAGALTHRLRVTAYCTVGDGGADDVLNKFYQQFDPVGQRGFGERFISDVVHTPASNAVTLATGDSLNDSPAPVQVYGAYLDSALTGAWYDATVTQRLAGRAAVAWGATTAKSVGDYVYPLARSTGFIYRCTTAGDTGGTEPTFDGTAATDWPTTIGGTVTDGTVVWTCAQRYDPARPYYQTGVGAVHVTTSSDVQVAYAPRWLREQTFDLKRPEVTGGATQARRMTRYGSRRLKQ